MQQLRLTLLFAIINFGTLALGSLFAGNEPTSSWYLSLNKAPWTPPGWVFGFAWSTIMLLFSIYLSKVFIASRKKRLLIITYAIQVVLNCCWNFLFFYLKMPGLAFVNMVLLLITICYFYVHYSKTSKNYKFLLLPYLCWLTIALSLNFYILIYN